MPQVPYSDYKTVWARVVRRRMLKINGSIGGRNIATFKWHARDGRNYVTTRISGGTTITEHAERMVWTHISARFLSLFWIYTELEPCGGPTGGCAKWLTNTQSFPQARIFWTWPYPKTLSGGIGAQGWESGINYSTGSGDIAFDLRQQSVSRLKIEEDSIKRAYLENLGRQANNDAKRLIHDQKNHADYMGVTVELPDTPAGMSIWD